MNHQINLIDDNYATNKQNDVNSNSDLFITSKTITDSTKAQLLCILHTIEQELGHLCQIKIKNLECNGSGYNTDNTILTIGDQVNIVIYDAVNEYIDLEGTYSRNSKYGIDSSIDSVINSVIRSKVIKEVFNDTVRYSHRDGYGQAGVCIVCNKWSIEKKYCYYMIDEVNDTYSYLKGELKSCVNCGFDLDIKQNRYHSIWPVYNESLIYHKKDIIAKLKLVRVE